MSQINHEALASHIVSLLSLPELKAMAQTFLERCYNKDNQRAIIHAAEYGWHEISDVDRQKYILDLDLLDELEESALSLEGMA